MNPREVISEIRQYTNNDYIAQLKDIIEVQSAMEDIVGFILSLIVTVIIIVLAIVTLLDICFITMPVFQDAVIHKRWDGSIDPNARVRLISHDARIAVQQSMTQATGKSALSLYLSRRIKTYCVSAVVIYIALTGSSVLVPLIAKVVTSIVEVFNAM